MDSELDKLERSIGAKLRQAMPPVSLSPEAIARMRPARGDAKVVPLSVGSRAAGPWWKSVRGASLAAAVAVMAFLILAPSGRALAKTVAATVTSVWTGKVGKAPGEVLWVNLPTQKNAPPVPQGPGEKVKTVAEAAAKVGFQPVQSTMKEARLDKIEVKIVNAGDDYQSRWIDLRYTVDTRSYQVTTMVHYRKWDGEWKPIPQTNVVGYAVSEQPTRNVRTIKIGGTEGLAFDVMERKVGGTELWRTDVTWLAAGNERIVRLYGIGSALTDAFAQSFR